MQLTRLRDQCARVLDTVALPRPFTLDGFCELVARRRGRVLYLHPLPVHKIGADLPCGAWLGTDAADHVFAASTSRLHQQHIVLHEIAHMLCGHVSRGEVPVELLMPDLDPAMIRLALRRGGYSDRQEQEAEMVACLIAERADASVDAGAEPATRVVSQLLQISTRYEGRE
jgi:hypothetical protein